MALTAAERMQRTRAHRRGDHSLCNPDTCNPDTAGELSPGEQLEKDMLAERDMTAAEKALCNAIGKTRDELDELEAYLYGRRGKWLSAVLEDLGGNTEVTILVDKASAELDRKRGTFTRLLSELRQYGVAAARTSASTPGPHQRATGTAGPPAGGRDDLASIRAAARARKRT